MSLAGDTQVVGQPSTGGGAVPTKPYPGALPPGTLLNENYRIDRVLGTGGFAITYLCFDTFFEVQVAIKEYFPRDWAERDMDSTIRLVRNPQAFEYGRTRFFEEAKLLAKLDHWNIVRVRSAFKANDTAYLVMNYYEGAPLSDRLRDEQGAPRRLSEIEALGIMRKVLTGLEKVHQTGIVHLDIKPGNIYLTDKGRPVLLDFGAARVIVKEDQSGVVIGTPPYMAYEQVQGLKVAAPTDIYACAAVLYQMVTGMNIPDALVRAEADPLIPPSELVKTLSPAVDRAIMRGLELDMTKRPQSAREFQELLASEPAQRRLKEALSPKHKETLAREIHRLYVDELTRQGHTLADNPALVPWKRLSPGLQDSNRDQAEHIEARLKMIGCVIAPWRQWWRSPFGRTPEPISLKDEEVEYLAEREHERWFEERKQAGWRYDNNKKDIENKLSPSLLPWGDLGEDTREQNRSIVRRIPQLLSGIGFAIRRLSD
jgi:serine/threonine protein kinase